MNTHNQMKRKLALLLMAVGVCASAFAGGGWPQPRGSGYFKLYQSWILSSRFFGPNGDEVDIVTNGLYFTGVYGEYGITDRLTGIVNMPFFVRGTLNEIRFNQSGQRIPGDAVNSVGDAEVALKYGIIVNKPVVVSATLLLGLPLGVTGGGDSQILQTGDGEFNQMIRVDVSHSFSAAGIFASVYGAFNNRTRDFSDEVRVGGEVGTTWRKWTPILKLNVVQSLFNGSGTSAENGIFSNNTEYVSPLLEMNYAVKERWGISASGAFAFSGSNILAAPMWSVGVYLKK